MFGLFENQGADGADFDAFAALDASGFGEGFVLVSRDDPLETTPGKANGPYVQLLLTYPYAFSAEDALVGIIGEDRTAVVNGKVPLKPPESGCLYFNTQVFSSLQEFTRTVL